MADPKDPFDEEAAQRADQNRANDIVSEHAPPFGKGDLPPVNDNRPLTPEEKRELILREFPRKTQERDAKREIPRPGSKEWTDFLWEVGSVIPPAERPSRRDDPERDR